MHNSERGQRHFGSEEARVCPNSLMQKTKEVVVLGFAYQSEKTGREKGFVYGSQGICDGLYAMRGSGDKPLAVVKWKHRRGN